MIDAMKDIESKAEASKKKKKKCYNDLQSEKEANKTCPVGCNQLIEPGHVLNTF